MPKAPEYDCLGNLCGIEAQCYLGGLGGDKICFFSEPHRLVRDGYAHTSWQWYDTHTGDRGQIEFQNGKTVFVINKPARFNTGR